MTLKTFSFFVVTALFLIGVESGNAAAVTKLHTIYDIPAPPITPTFSFFHSTDQIFLPLLSQSFSEIGPGDNGATRYLVHAVKTAEVVYGATATFTQPVPTGTTTVPFIYTLEQDASHIHDRILPTTIDSHWAVGDSETNCTMDLSKNTGECVIAIFMPENVAPPITTTSFVSSWTAAPTPVATITEVTSAAERGLGGSLAGVVGLFVAFCILQL